MALRFHLFFIIAKHKVKIKIKGAAAVDSPEIPQRAQILNVKNVFYYVDMIYVVKLLPVTVLALLLNAYITEATEEAGKEEISFVFVINVVY